MGGSSYDRDVYSSSSSSSWGSSFGASTTSTSKLSRSSLDPAMDPVGRVIKSNSKNPIVFMLDVTGSNEDFARVIYDKFPMFYGEIVKQGYLDDFDISICAVGDAYTDYVPLQVGDFAKGIELDPIIEKLYLEGHGGGQGMESYELAAYYLLKNVEFEPDANPMIFFIGDEAPYPEVNQRQIEEYQIGRANTALATFDEALTNDPQTNKRKSKKTATVDLKTSTIFKQLRDKCNDNVFMYLNKYSGRSFDSDITKAWTGVLSPEHTIMIKKEKEIVDLILGTIAMVSKKRNLKTYAIDMANRGQDQQRIADVSATLTPLEKTLLPVVKTTGDLTKKKGVDKSETRSIRL